MVPAIVDLASSGRRRDGREPLHDDALALRDLFKFEFFFAEKGEFLAEVDAEAAARPTGRSPRRSSARSSRRTGRRPRRSPPTATRRSTPTSSPREACGLAEQFLLQARIYCADAVSSSYVDGAVRLAEHRGLLDAGPDLDAASRRAPRAPGRAAVRAPGELHYADGRPTAVRAAAGPRRRPGSWS